jgi:hypothetical protein
LLKWLVSNPSKLRHVASGNKQREALLKSDPQALRDALFAIEKNASGRAWHLLEGTTYPDVTIITPDAIVVIEGKRTELGPTLNTAWLTGRHQIWRHIEAAWCAREGKRVFGFFIIEGDEAGIPARWKEAAGSALYETSLCTSFPHRSTAEIAQIASCYLGVATWQQVCSQFGIDFLALPDATATCRLRFNKRLLLANT